MLFITVGAKSAVWIKKSCRLKCQLFDFIGKHTMLLGRKFWDCRNKEEEYLNINIFNKELAQAKRTLNRANRKNLLSARDRNSRFSPLRAWHDKNAAFPCIKKRTIAQIVKLYYLHSFTMRSRDGISRVRMLRYRVQIASFSIVLV